MRLKIWKEFLNNRNKTHKEKSSLDFNQFICFKCKSKQSSLNNIITKLSTGFNACIEAFGVCQKCRYDKLKRLYKRSELAKIKEIFKIELDELSILSSGHEPKTTIGSVNSAEFFITTATGLSFAIFIGVSNPEIIFGLILGGVLIAPFAY